VEYLTFLDLEVLTC